MIVDGRRVWFDCRYVAALVASVLVSFLSTQSAAAQTSIFQVSGTAEIGSDSLAARQKACDSGIRSAVDRAIESIMDSASINANRRAIDDMVGSGKRYAQRSEILEEGRDDPEYRCRVRVTVDTGLLTRHLQESTIAPPRPPGPRVMVIVDEYRLSTAAERPAQVNAPALQQAFPDLPPVRNGSAAAALLKVLREGGYQVVDEEYARTIREQRIGVMRDFISNSSKVGELAKDLGAKRHVEWLILGGTKVSSRAPSGTRFVADAVMVARVINTSTGEIIASEEGTKAIEETSHETALSEAAAAVARALGGSLAAQMKGAVQVRMLLVNVFNVSQAQTGLAFQAYLESLPGVSGVRQLNFDGTNGLLELNVAFQGETTKFSSLVFAQPPQEFRELILRHSSPSALDFALGLPTAPVPPVGKPKPGGGGSNPRANPVAVDDPPSPVSIPDRESSLAVVIGIGNYREASIPKLPHAARDAATFTKYLENVGGLRKENIRVLSDDRAARSDIEDIVEQWLPLRVTETSEVFVYFAGHGAVDPGTGETYLVPFEGSPESTSRMYSLKRFYEGLARLKARNVTVFLDSCFSGGERSVATKDDRPIVITPRIPSTTVTVLAAAAGNQVSSEYVRTRHGLFTYFLLRGMRGEADTSRDGWIDLGELSSFVQDRVRSTAAVELGREQTPVLTGGPNLESKKRLRLFKFQK
jgi:hypothetical protein